MCTCVWVGELGEETGRGRLDDVVVRLVRRRGLLDGVRRNFRFQLDCFESGVGVYMYVMS